MIKRRHGNLVLLKEPAPSASQQLEREGFALVRGVLTADEVSALGAEITAVFDSSDPGPHVPRPENVPWPDAIPYPVFAIGVHIFLQDCPMEAGPTAVLPGSHRSGRLPPRDRITDTALTFENKPAVLLPAQVGDAILFVSDAWHRGTAAQPGYGRFFLQAHYARRDIAQRIAMTSEVNQVTPDAAARATTERERTLIGLHAPFFYDG